MNEEYLELRKELIRKTFKDKRKIKCRTPEDVRMLDDDVYPGGEIFTTEDGEFKDLEFQINDFDEVELAKYVGFAESLYEKHHKKISIYIICPKNIDVYVKELPIKSKADFTIKLYCSQEDPCRIILDIINDKIKSKQPLDSDDIRIVEMLPEMCDKKDRMYYRVESLKILNRYVT